MIILERLCWSYLKFPGWLTAACLALLTVATFCTDVTLGLAGSRVPRWPMLLHFKSTVKQIIHLHDWNAAEFPKRDLKSQCPKEKAFSN